MQCSTCGNQLSLFDIHCRSCDARAPIESIDTQLIVASEAAAAARAPDEPLLQSFEIRHAPIDAGAILGGVLGAVAGAAFGMAGALGQAATDGLAGYTPEEERAMQLYRRAQKPY